MILITGADGQLGQEFSKSNFFENAIFCSKKDLDITDYKSTLNFCKDNNIKTIINCAAYTNVDQAEVDQIDAFNVNSAGAKNLAKITKLLDGLLIHFSTDYVFDGISFSPYSEAHQTNPISIYGQSKLKGEEAIQETNCNSLIIRFSWLYSSEGNNFVNTIIKLSKSKKEIQVVEDQVACPTYAKNVVDFLFANWSEIQNIKSSHLFHFSNNGHCNWYEFAQEIVKINNLNLKILPIKSNEWPSKAQRPKYSLLDHTKIAKAFSIDNQNWKEGLKSCLKKVS